MSILYKNHSPLNIKGWSFPIFFPMAFIMSWGQRLPISGWKSMRNMIKFQKHGVTTSGFGLCLGFWRLYLFSPRHTLTPWDNRIQYSFMSVMCTLFWEQRHFDMSIYIHMCVCVFINPCLHTSKWTPISCSLHVWSMSDLLTFSSLMGHHEQKSIVWYFEVLSSSVINFIFVYNTSFSFFV